MAGASRILPVHTSGASVVWCRDTYGNGMRGAEFVIPVDVYTRKSENISNSRSPEGTKTSSIAYYRDGYFYTVFMRGNGMFERYRHVM